MSSSFFSLGLAQRLALFLLVFAAEWSPVSSLVKKGRGAGSLLQLAIVFGFVFLALGYARSKSSFQTISSELKRLPIGWGFLAGHVGAFLAFVGLSVLPLDSNASGILRYGIAALWYAAGLIAIALAGCAFVPPKLAWQLARTTGYAWAYALGVALIAWRLVNPFSLWNGAVWTPAIDLYWKPATDATFRLVNALLHLFLSNVVVDPASMVIGTPSFQVAILPWCAGFEGMALMLVFSVAWLWFFRREFRFPQALLLIPAGMAVMWLSNAVRITALILIGVAGAPDVAVGGFHSQAGWIAFNCVALGFAILSRRVPWVTYRAPERPLPERAGRNPVAAYLMPFLVILAAAMISRAASGGFEWLYPLRFVAVAITLWFFRSQYSDLDWRVGWYSPLAGVAALGIWLGLDLASGAHADNGISSGLASWPYSARVAWLAIRTIAAVTTVPIAEELAFRGFLIRRLMAADFESLDPRRYTGVALLISSLAFGLLHGERWLAGTLAGLLYAAAYLRRGRIGDAVVAHATTNALLAAFVLLGGKWYLW